MRLGVARPACHFGIIDGSRSLWDNAPRNAVSSCTHGRGAHVAEEDDPNEAAPPTPESIEFHFIKSVHFRTVHVDGAWGGITPRGAIQCAIYSERQPIPRTIKQYLTEDSRLSDKYDTLEARDGMIREVEANLIMSLSTAVSLRDWLNTKINQYTTLFPQLVKDQENDS